MHLRSLSCLLAVGTLAFCLVGCKDNRQFPEERPKLTVLTVPDFPPFESVGEDGYCQGIDIDIVGLIANKLNMNLELSSVPFQELFKKLEEQDADMGVAGISITEERKEIVDFSEPYYTAGQVIVVLKDSPVKDLSDLQGKTVGVKGKTTGEAMLRTLYPDGKLETFPKVSEAILALMQNRVDAVVIDNEPARRFVSQNRADLKVLETPLSNEKYAIAFPKGKTELVAKVNQCLTEMTENGTLQTIFAKWKLEE